MTNLVILSQSYRNIEFAIIYNFMVVSVVKRIRMVIADSNVDYLESFSSFMRHASEGDRFIISYFSETAKLQSFIEQNDSIDILLTTRELFNNSIPITGDATIIYLDDDV